MFGRERKRRRRLEAGFGKKPDVWYTDGDMDRVRAWYDWRREREPDTYSVDEVTWHDLDMDRVFRRIDPGLSTPGQQVLYDMLRHPALDREEYERRARLIALMEKEPGLRLDVQTILDRLGRTRRADMCTSFAPEARGRWRLALYLGMLAVFFGAAALALSGAVNASVPALVFTANVLVRDRVMRRIRREFDSLNYCVAEVFALRRVRKLRAPALDRELVDAYGALDQLRSALRTGGLSGMDRGDVGDLLASALLLDLIIFEFLKNRLWARQAALRTVFRTLGELDAAIAAASWRRSMDVWCEPELAFDGADGLTARGMVHPLLEDAVPNDLDLGRPMLLTGSNASGKSTYLRTALLCALLSQSLCTAPAESYRGGAFYIYSSMALADDLLAGESYYVTEIRSVRRILEAAETRRPILCAVDEVLRGTNTAERIAAASVILQALADAGAKCLAATHDLELCSLTGDSYDMYHFTETVGEGEMTFDYRLRPGPARTRNAIRLLELMGFDPALTEKAHARAARFLDTGVWE